MSNAKRQLPPAGRRVRRWICYPFLSLLLALLPAPSAVFASTASPRPPNFVLILTDDLDQTLGGGAALTKTRRLIADNGAELPNWFVHTPVCCPSRSERLTGRMFHNLKVPEPGRRSCMHVDVAPDVDHPFYSRYYFARHFAERGYTVGVFGKHLNNDNPDGPPPGVDRWLVNGGGDYNDPTFTWASAGVEPATVKFDNCTDGGGRKQPCYSTSVIGNSSLAWIRQHLREQSNMPFFAYVAVKAPHLQDGPGYPVAIPAPWYSNATVIGTAAPRTPNWNASCPDHHWLVRRQPPLTDEEARHVDELYVSRLRTLLSVDDLVEETVRALDDLGVLENTYVLFTSDNGYRLGQFRMPQGKFHAYENDIRVPFLIRGPGVHPGSVRGDILGTHVDIMPTLLGLSAPDVDDDESVIPPTMDGQNLARQLLLGGGYADDGGQPRRSVILIEYIGLGEVWRYGHLEDAYNNTFRALRVMDGTQPPGSGRRNLKYVEFTDCQRDWNFTEEPMETELFDLDVDPFELTNLARDDDRRDLIDGLRDVMRGLFACSGRTCRDLRKVRGKGVRGKQVISNEIR